MKSTNDFEKSARAKMITHTVAMVLLALISGCTTLSAAPPIGVDNKKAAIFVAVTDRDFEQFGPFPLDRRLYADALSRMSNEGARAAGLKFFFDRPTASDALLAGSMRKLPTFVQQGIDLDKVTGTRSGPLTGHAQPLSPAIANAATSIGFVEAELSEDHDRIELRANIDGWLTKSLQLLLAERALGVNAQFEQGRVHLGSRTLPVDPQGRAICAYSNRPLPPVVPLGDVLGGSPGVPPLRDRVVLIGYAAANSPVIAYSETRKIPIHLVFYQQVSCLADW